MLDEYLDTIGILIDMLSNFNLYKDRYDMIIYRELK